MLCLILAILMVVSLAACSGTTQKKDNNVLIMGTSADYAPFEFMYADANGDDAITLGEAYNDTVDTIVNTLGVDQSTQYHGDRSFVLWFK